MFVIVKENEEAIVERFGEFYKKLTPGLHILVPFIDKLKGLQDPNNHKKFINYGKIKKTEEIFHFPKDDRVFFAKDKSQLKLRAEISYQILDAYKAVYEVDYLFDALNQLCSGILQSRLIDAPDDINQIDYLHTLTKNLVSPCNDYCQKWGVKILKFDLKQITDTNGVRTNF